MFTLNKILKRLELFQTQHKQLNSFFFGKIPEIGASNSVNYPLLYCQLAEDSSEVNERVEYFNMEFWIVDLPNTKTGKDRSVQEVLSDTKQIANDLVAYLRYTNFSEGSLLIDLPVSMRDLIDAGDDCVSGWSFTLRLKTANQLDLCGIPMNGSYTPPDGYELRSGNTLYYDVNSVYNTYESPEVLQLSTAFPGTIGIISIMLHTGYVGVNVAPFATLLSGTYDSTSINLMTFTYNGGVDVTYTITQI